MRKTPLRRRSAKVSAAFEVYGPEVARRVKAAKGTCARCRAGCGKLDPHHYAGSRRGPNLFRFVIVGRRCHDWIEAHGKQAVAQGWKAEVNGTLNENESVAAAETRFQEMQALDLI